jgi:hypothetical protein
MAITADVVVMVDGSHGSNEQATLSMALNRLCIPLPFTGGEAGKLWNSQDGDVLRTRLARSADVPSEWEAMT